MELILALSIGVLFGSGIWLVLRPRTFQLLMGLMLMSYAVNLFIFAMGRLWTDKPPLVVGRGCRIRRSLPTLATGAGVDGHRHRFCHHRTVSGADARLPWGNRDRPR